MFERGDESGRHRVPSLLEADDPAVVHRDPPVPVWVDLAALVDVKRRGKDYRHESRDRLGVSMHGVIEGLLVAWVRGDRGLWIGCVSCRLERGGAPVLTSWALVPSWALKRRRAGDRFGKTSNRPTAAQAAARERHRS